MEFWWQEIEVMLMYLFFTMHTLRPCGYVPLCLNLGGAEGRGSVCIKGDARPTHLPFCSIALRRSALTSFYVRACWDFSHTALRGCHELVKNWEVILSDIGMVFCHLLRVVMSRGAHKVIF